MTDPASESGPAERLQRELIARVASGELTPGTRLPTVRALAEAEGVAVNTAAKAYRALEEQGVIETRGRAGSFVAWSSGSGEAEVERAARAYADLASRSGVDQARALDLVTAALRR